eukprot:563186-Prymnesium_polylepis.1
MRSRAPKESSKISSITSDLLQIVSAAPPPDRAPSSPLLTISLSPRRSTASGRRPPDSARRRHLPLTVRPCAPSRRARTRLQ